MKKEITKTLLLEIFNKMLECEKEECEPICSLLLEQIERRFEHLDDTDLMLLHNYIVLNFFKKEFLIINKEWGIGEVLFRGMEVYQPQRQKIRIEVLQKIISNTEKIEKEVFAW